MRPGILRKQSSSLPHNMFTQTRANNRTQIRSPQTLQALVRTCHAFRDIFTPFLYNIWRLELANYSPSALVRKSLSLPTGLCHTRDLEIMIAEFRFTGFRENPYDTWMNGSYATCIAKILKEMTNIRSFRYVAAQCLTCLL